MSAQPSESGLEELMRLSRQTARQAQDMEEAEQYRAAQRETAQSIRQGLKEISISVAIGQLKPVATEDVLREVEALKDKPDVQDLRSLISRILHLLERKTSNLASGKQDLPEVEKAVKTLAILLELYFALSD